METWSFENVQKYIVMKLLITNWTLDCVIQSNLTGDWKGCQGLGAWNGASQQDREGCLWPCELEQVDQ